MSAQIYGMSRIMNLPARTQGPHSWLWRLLFAEAEKRTSPSGVNGTATDAAAWLWQGVVMGVLWVRGDRTGFAFDEPDLWLPRLVDDEVERHLLISEEMEASLEPDDPRRLVDTQRPLEERRTAIGRVIWQYLGSGWARVDEEEDRILFWDPVWLRFTPFTAELSLEYAGLFRDLTRILPEVEARYQAEPYTGKDTGKEDGRAPEVPADVYTGRSK
jgi:hypothetical protein